MKVKLLVLDLDGTLLKSHNKLHPKNIEAVKLANKEGIKVIIATGRSPQSTYKFANELEIYENSQHIICYNGGYVVNLKTGEVIINKELLLETIKQLIILCKKYKVAFWGYAVDEKVGYIYKKTFWIWIIQKISKRKLVKVNEDSQIRVYKLLLFAKKSRINKLVKVLEELNLGEIAIIPRRLKSIIEFTPINVNKANAVKKLAEMWNISREEVMAIGDSMNDYKLIEWAGYGIAMKNSDNDLLKVATDITCSYKHAGVSEVIHKYILDDVNSK